MKSPKPYGFSLDGYFQASPRLTQVTEKLSKFMFRGETEGVDRDTRRRVAVLAGLSSISVLTLLFFGVFSCVQGSVLLGTFDLLMALIFLVNIYDARIRKKIHFNITLIVALTSLFFIYLYVSGGHSQTGFVWYFTYPLLASFLLGSRKGAIASGVMVVPIILMLLIRPEWSQLAVYSVDFQIRFLFAFVVVSLFSYLIERASEENRQEIYISHRTLENLVAIRTEELVQEVQKHKEAKELLAEKEHWYRTIFEKSVNGIFVREKRSEQYFEANPAAEKLTGLKKKELIACKKNDILSQMSPESGLNEVCNNSPATIEPVSCQRPDGSRRIAHLYEVSLNEDVVMEIAQDVTDLKEAQENRLQLEQRLHKAQKMEAIGNLAGGIAHDFNNILVAILGFAELSLDEVHSDDSLRRNLQEIYRAGIRAKDLVSQILAYARQTEVTRQPVEIAKIMNEVAKLLRSTIPTTIDIETSIDTGSFVMADETQLHQIVMNLCTNGAYAMRLRGGTLKIDLRDEVIEQQEECNGSLLEPGEYVVLKVSDTGSGIESDILDSIFDPYFTTKDVGEGTGLGLAVVKGIVETCGGAIKVDSYVDRTVFTIYFPSAPFQHEISQDKEEVQSGNGELVLFVDDEEAIVKIGARMIESLGYAVIPCTSSLQALEIFSEKSEIIDLVVTDMTMPRMTGEELARHLVSIRQDIPILLCSGYSDIIYTETARQNGVTAFFYKPFDKAMLSKQIRLALDNATVSEL